MKRTALALLLCLAAATPAAAALEPRAEVASRTHTLDVYAQARAQLEKERAGLNARAQQLSQEIAEAKRDRSPLTDAQLKARLREALEVARQLEAADRKIAQLDRMTRDAAGALQALSTDRRLTPGDRVAAEGAARRALSGLPSAAVADVDVHVTAGMDADALRERADLAQDYEEKLRREAARADARIHELEATASVAGEAAHLSGDRRLFDEEDRTLHGTRVVSRTNPASAAHGGTSAALGDGTGGSRSTTSSSGGGGATAPSAGGTSSGGSSGDPGSGGNSPAPSGTGQGATGSMDNGTGYTGSETSSAGGPPASTPATSSAGRTESALPRSQTVMDERTFSLLRESRAPSADLSPAEELRQLQARREALLRQAARLRALREDLDSRARAARGAPATR